MTPEGIAILSITTRRDRFRPTHPDVRARRGARGEPNDERDMLARRASKGRSWEIDVMSRRPASTSGTRAMDEPDVDDPREEPPGAVPEMIRRMATLGLTGFFMTEGAIRRAFGETVPQEWVDFANDQSERTRAEVIDRVVAEMTRQLADTDPAEFVSQFLSGHTIEIEAKFKISPRSKDDDGPSIRTRFKADRS